jgi:hypothetical protein
MSGEMPLAWIERPDGVKYRATAAIAALAHHDEQTARRQFREFLQRRADERQIRLDLRSARWRAVLRQTGLRQYSRHRLVVHAQLPSDGTDTPLLDKVIA